MITEKHIILAGMNHNTAHVEIREKFSLETFCEPEAQAFSKHFTDICSELFMLSTCNRVEIIAIVETDNLEEVARAQEALINRWAQIRNASVESLKAHIFSYVNDEAIRHLFAVASSLDSLVLGEPQILGQLKQAYKKCSASKSTGAVSTRLLHKSFSVAKRVRTETALASSAVSISYAAVELAKRIFNSVNEHNALIIGAGEMAELAALHLKQAGIREIYVANRTYENAVDLAEKVEGIPLRFEDLHNYLDKADIVISSTGAQNAILCADDIKPIMKIRKNKAMFFIDIAMPRDIDPDVNNLDNVYLYDIDDLKEVVEENMAFRRSEAEKAWDIVQEETGNFQHWLSSLHTQPTIIALNTMTENVIRNELERTLKKLPEFQNMSEESHAAFERMTKSLVKKLNHTPLDYLKTYRDRDKAIVNIQNVFGIEDFRKEILDK